MFNFAIIIAHDRAQKHLKMVKSRIASRTVALRCDFLLLNPDIYAGPNGTGLVEDFGPDQNYFTRVCLCIRFFTLE